jgi:nitroreductase
MRVSEAVVSRRSVRRFTDRPVDPEMLRDVLETAQRAPSGGNLQPWHGLVLSGDPLARLIDHLAAEAIPLGRGGMQPEYDIYPPGLDEPYESRRTGVGEEMYEALGIARGDKKGRLAQFVSNYRAFEAPVLMLVHTPKFMGPPQWADIGIWLQTVMLLLREKGMDSCPQEAWAVYQRHIREVVNLPADHTLFCGLSIGWRDEDAPVNHFAVSRVPLSEAVRFEGI